jgi:hypothetical protein
MPYKNKYLLQFDIMSISVPFMPCIMSRGLPFLNICDYDTQANTSEKHSPNKYELIHSKRYPEAIPKIIAEKWDPKNTSLYTKEESPPGGGRLFEVLSHRLWKVFLAHLAIGHVSFCHG